MGEDTPGAKAKHEFRLWGLRGELEAKGHQQLVPLTGKESRSAGDVWWQASRR